MKLIQTLGILLCRRLNCSPCLTSGCRFPLGLPCLFLAAMRLSGIYLGSIRAVKVIVFSQNIANSGLVGCSELIDIIPKLGTDLVMSLKLIAFQRGLKLFLAFAFSNRPFKSFFGLRDLNLRILWLLLFHIILYTSELLTPLLCSRSRELRTHSPF